MTTPATATIDNRHKYGWNRYPHGRCTAEGCERAACHEYQGRKVCRQHLDRDVLFCPFLGQQTKMWSARERYVLGGGGVGGSKTHMGARLWLRQWTLAEEAYKAHGHRSKGWSLFLRRTIPELLQVINDFRLYYKRIDSGSRWNEQYKMCEFTNGYTHQFGGMEHAHDWQKYWGPQYTLVVFDEATEFTVEQIEKLDQRIRTDDSVLAGREQLYLLTNPIGGTTKQYIKRRFVKPAPPEKRIYVETKLEDGRIRKDSQVYIPSNLFDNPALVESGAYEATIRRHSMATQRALLHNDWDVDEGSWLGEDWDPRYHLCHPFVLPRGWHKFKMADYGYRARSAVLWCAVDPDDNWTIYRSISVTKLTVDDLAKRIREIELQPLIVRVGETRVQVTDAEWDDVNDCSTVYGPMDAELWSRAGHPGVTRGEVLQNAGTGFYRSAKDPDGAAEQIRARLRRRMPYNSKGDLVAGLRFFTTCKTRVQQSDGTWDETGPIITIPSISFDPNNPDRWDTEGDDHDIDALGYGALSRAQLGTADEPLPPGQGVVYDLLKFRADANAQPTLPNWYKHNG